MKLKQRRFDALVSQFADDLYRYALWLSKSHSVADDITQETWLRAWRGLDSLKETKAAKSWLYTIVRREFLRTFERKTLPTSSLEDIPFDIEDQNIHGPERKHEIDIIRQAMWNLEPKYREPLLLQVLGGFTCEEIARLLNSSPSAVMTQLFRARKQIKNQLNKTPRKRRHNQQPF